MFGRGFYLQHQPRLLLTDEERASHAYRRYALHEPHVPDSGVGYGFKLYAKGVHWHRLFAVDEAHTVGRGQVFDDLIFHLGGAVRNPEVGMRNSPSLRRILTWLQAAVIPYIPQPLKPLLGLLKRPVFLQRLPDGALQEAKRRLFENPEEYVRMLRSACDGLEK